MSDVKIEVRFILEGLISDVDSLRKGLTQEFDLLAAGQWPPSWAVTAGQGGRHTIILRRMLQQAEKRDQLQACL